MSDDSDGIRRLTAYLNQTRRQATQSIDVLTARVNELEQNLETSTLVAERLEAERDYFKGISEQLKLENSKKWRLHERDDWKSLVESCQLDRVRLQDENAKMEEELEMLGLRSAGNSSGAHDGDTLHELNRARERIKQLENSLRLVSPEKDKGNIGTGNGNAGAGAAGGSVSHVQAISESKRSASTDGEDEEEEDTLVKKQSKTSDGGWFFGFGLKTKKVNNPVIIV
jgi:hypothetical protein